MTLGPTRLAVQPAGDRQHRVADLLGRQPAAREAPEQPVVGILPHGDRRVGCRVDWR